MDVFTIAVWLLTAGFLIFSAIKDKEKTKEALRSALMMGKGMVLSILSIVFAIGLILTLIPPERIAYYMGRLPELLATVLGAALGTVTLVPALIAFPLVSTLIGAGVAVTAAVAFLTTLTMVGVVTIPLEIKEFGGKFTAVRNILSFVAAVIIAIIMGRLI